MAMDLDDLRAMLMAAKGERAPDIAAERAAYDKRESTQPLPAGWRGEAIDLGRPAMLLTGPGARSSRTILHFHGGGYRNGSFASHSGFVATLAKAAEAEGILLAYRRAPENTFPAAFDDALTAYRALLDQGRAAQSIVLMGDSAGGGLALAVAAALKGEGLPAPLAVVAIAPWTDLTQSGPSMIYRAEDDPICSKEGLDASAADYLGGADPRDPRASPLYADLSGLPQTLIHVGGDEVLLSDSERFIEAARAVDVDATVEIWPGLFHIWHRFYAELEESREGVTEIGAWLKRRWKT